MPNDARPDRPRRGAAGTSPAPAPGRRAERGARRGEAQRTLAQVAARLTTIHEPGGVLQLVVDEAARLLEADGALLDIVDAASGRISWAYDAGIRDPATRTLLRGLSLETGQGVFGTAVAERRVMSTGDYLADERFGHAPGSDELARRLGFHSLMAAPLVGEDGVLGVLGIFHHQRDAYGDDDAELLEAFAGQAAIALVNARLIEELAASRRELERRADAERSLREMGARLAAIREPGALLQHLVEEARRLLDADRAQLDLFDREAGMLRSLHIAGGEAQALEEQTEFISSPSVGINALAMASGGPVISDDYLADERFEHVPESDAFVRETGIRAVLAAPMLAEGDLIGVLKVNAQRVAAFGAAQATLLQTLADQAAVAVSNARLHERSRASEARFRFLAENSPDVIWSGDADGRFTFLGDSVQRLTGWRPEELLGQPAATLIAPAERPYVEALWATIASAPSTIRYRFAVLRRDGSTAPAEMHATSLFDGERYVGAHGSVRDMTEHERLERQLRESEGRYRDLVQSSPDGVWQADAEGRFTFWSETAQAIFGWSPSQVLGRPYAVVVAEGSLADAAAAWGSLADGSQDVVRVRLRLRHADGAEIPAEVSAAPILREGLFTGAHGSVRDLREQDRLARGLQESEARYRYLVKASPDVVWAVDRESRFTFLSDRLEPVTGWRPEELLGQPFEVIVQAEDLPVCRATFAAVQAEPSAVRELHIRMARRDGRQIRAEIWLTGQVTEGRFQGAHGSIRDTSERERMQRDLQRQAAELAAGQERAHLARELHDSVTQALFSMSLETRTLELLLERDPPAVPAKLATLRDLQRDALAEMRSLIFELRPGSLEQDGLARALRTHAAALQGRVGLPIAVEADLEERLPIEIEDGLYRIAQEALHNVVKHASASQVRLGLSRTGDEVRLVVSDDGTGFDPAAIPAGHLGLAGMRARAERLGAALRIESRPGGGTRIEVTVPAAACAETPGAPGEALAADR